MTTPKGSSKSRREQVHINLSTSVSSSSEGSPPVTSYSSKLFNVVPPSTTFELRSASNAIRRNTATPDTLPTIPEIRTERTRGESGNQARGDSFAQRAAGGWKAISRRVLDSLWVNEEKRSINSRITTGKAQSGGKNDRLSPSRQVRISGSSRGLSRLGQFVVLALFLLGLWELSTARTVSDVDEMHGRPIRIKGRDPFSVLKVLQPRGSSFYSTTIPSLESTWRIETSSASEKLPSKGGDVTAILLHWKRTDNLRVIVASLCQYDFIESIFVWNNNPDIVLTQATFTKSRCPSSKLQVYNSPHNSLFLARHLACMQATTPYCYFQDDDWFVPTLRSLYFQFKRDPEGSVVVSTTREMAVKYRSQWCFFQEPLHTCFTWLGTGAFTSRTHVANYLDAVSTLDLPRDELAHADNSFTTFLNNPPYVMGSNAIVEMKAAAGYSDGSKGDLRNQLYIQKGIGHFARYLNATFSKLPSTTPLPINPLTLDTEIYRNTPTPPLPPHPYAHHARSPCVPSDLCFFLSNIPLLLPPDATPYPGPNRVKTFSEWEQHVGTIGKAEEEWSLEWGYENAVDSKPGTALRSLDVAKSGDYVGLGLIQPLDPVWTPSIVLHFVFEDVEKFLPRFEVQVSSDGHEWSQAVSPSHPKPLSFSCKATNLRSTRPDISFPASNLLSPEASSIRQEELSRADSNLKTWWKKHRRRRDRLRECYVEVASTIELESIQRRGWTFIRLALKDNSEVGKGWGVYEIWLKAAKLEV
ncbi:uncharacterized protein JCM6883_003969 [Sporobolomyces salmoneus]|uniref:uncharacterized protein n=1 Tax=Sporobolomyces salmoneus TaxID=183962 RepID=UPI00316E59C1